MYFNLFVVWFLTGFWHGSDWNFILWGLYYFILLVIEKAFLGRLLEKIPRVFRNIYAILCIVFGWLLFVSEDISEGFEYLKTMFGGGAGLFTRLDLYDAVRHLIFAAVAVVGATPLPKKVFKWAYKKSRAAAVVGSVGAVLLVLLCTAYLVDSTFNPFLYWNF